MGKWSYYPTYRNYTSYTPIYNWFMARSQGSKYQVAKLEKLKGLAWLHLFFCPVWCGETKPFLVFNQIQRGGWDHICIYIYMVILILIVFFWKSRWIWFIFSNTADIVLHDKNVGNINTSNNLYQILIHNVSEKWITFTMVINWLYAIFIILQLRVFWKQ